MHHSPPCTTLQPCQHRISQSHHFQSRHRQWGELSGVRADILLLLGSFHCLSESHPIFRNSRSGTISQCSVLSVFRRCTGSTFPKTMNRKPLLLNRAKVKDAIGIKDAEPLPLKGQWWLVIPETTRDVIYLQLLGSHQRYANYSGEGILIHENALPISQN